MKLYLISAIIVLSLTGCSTIQDYCESSPEHSRVCVVTGVVVTAVVAGCIAAAATHSNQVQVVRNVP